MDSTSWKFAPTESFPRHLQEQYLQGLLPETIENTLKQIFGNKGAELILSYTERKNLNLKEASKIAKVLPESLQAIFGSSSVFVERFILESLYSKIGLKLEKKRGYKFVDYMKELSVIGGGEGDMVRLTNMQTHQRSTRRFYHCRKRIGQGFDVQDNTPY